MTRRNSFGFRELSRKKRKRNSKGGRRVMKQKNCQKMQRNLFFWVKKTFQHFILYQGTLPSSGSAPRAAVSSVVLVDKTPQGKTLSDLNRFLLFRLYFVEILQILFKLKILNKITNLSQIVYFQKSAMLKAGASHLSSNYQYFCSTGALHGFKQIRQRNRMTYFDN